MSTLDYFRFKHESSMPSPYFRTGVYKLEVSGPIHPLAAKVLKNRGERESENMKQGKENSQRLRMETGRHNGISRINTTAVAGWIRANTYW